MLKEKTWLFLEALACVLIGAGCSGNDAGGDPIDSSNAADDTPTETASDAASDDGESDGDASDDGSESDEGAAQTSECTTNADCVGSAADLESKDLKCLKPEVFCLEGACLVECASRCEVVRTDFNPCEQGVCAPGPNQGAMDAFCTMLPVSCTSTDQCPKFLPVTGEATDQWTCVDDVCAFPGFEYPTQ